MTSTIVPSLCRCVGLPLRVSSFLHGAAHISNHVLNKERLEAASIVQFAKFAISTRQHKPKKCTQPTTLHKSWHSPPWWCKGWQVVCKQEDYGNYIWIYGFLNIRTGILDYLREGSPWPAQPLKHADSKYTNMYFRLPPGKFSVARLAPWRYRFFRSFMEDLWMMNGGFMEDLRIYGELWKLYGNFMEDLWKIYGGFMEVIWRVYEGFMEDLWRIYEGFMEVIWRIYGRSMEDV